MKEKGISKESEEVGSKNGLKRGVKIVSNDSLHPKYGCLSWESLPFMESGKIDRQGK